MEKMTEAERKYWEQKRRLLLSEAAEIERMLNADRQPSPSPVLPAPTREIAVASVGAQGVGITGVKI